jgi:hypothetical protein
MERCLKQFRKTLATPDSLLETHEPHIGRADFSYRISFGIVPGAGSAQGVDSLEMAIACYSIALRCHLVDEPVTLRQVRHELRQASSRIPMLLKRSMG